MIRTVFCYTFVLIACTVFGTPLTASEHSLPVGTGMQRFAPPAPLQRAIDASGLRAGRASLAHAFPPSAGGCRHWLSTLATS